MNDRPLPSGYAETDIAIVGMAGRFPGSPDIETFWKNIRDGVDAAHWLDDDALRENGVTDEELADPDYVKACHPVEDMEGFDAGFFGFSPREAAIMDPQQRHFIELAWNALEHAGHAPESFDGSVGVFAGCGASLYLMRNLLTNRDLVENVGFFLLRHTGNDKDFLATRVSYLLNLTGPSVSVQTACSTALVAIHQACQSLLIQECDMALAGGSTYKQPHRVGYTYVEGEILSPDGKCRTFDADAEGTVFGSGSGVIVLRRLADALRDRDTVHAVIKGSAINNDGSAKVGYLAPSVDAQALNMAEAMAIAGIEPGRVGYLECHGTATPVGDPIEVVALAQAFEKVSAEKESIAIGSVKTNIGHLDTAAGVAGVIKTVQALKHAQVPPSLHFDSPNPGLGIEDTPFYVSSELHPWPAKGPHRIAGVGALGAGGTNAHLILQEAPPTEAVGAPGRTAQLLPFSAKTPSALDARGRALADFLREAESDLSLADVSHTLQVGRQGLAHRRFVVATDADDAAAKLGAADPKQTPTGEAPNVLRSVVFMFAGGGAQYPAMGESLYQGEAVYREAVDECVRLLQPQLDWDIKSLLFAPPEGREAAGKEMERPSRSLPCLFITQYAMARLLMSWGLDPEAMIGHSMGEYTAAHLAGVFSLADALSLVTVRGKLFETVPAGGMVSVPMSADELQALLPDTLSIAAANAPGLSVASGPVDALDALEKTLLEDDIECQRIHIDIAAHSSMLDGILDEFGAFCAKIEYSAPERPFVSNVSGTWITPEEATDPRYWVRHLRNTVRFADGVGVLLEDEGRAMVEVGPGRVLATLAGLHEDKKDTHAFVTTMRHPAEVADDVEVALATVGRLWLSGVTIDWSALRDGARRLRVPLPTYPFEHEPYFVEPGELTAPPPGLGRRADVGAWFWRPTWEKHTVPSKPPAAVEGSWLVFRDETGVGASLAERLSTLGGAVTSVLPGTEYTAEHGVYRVDPADRAHMERLVAELGSGDGVPSRIVHAWAAIDGPADETRTFYSLLHLAQALGQEGIDDEIRLDVLTTGGQWVGGEATLEPDRALVMGPVRVVPKEFPEISIRAIDLPHPSLPGWFEDRAVVQVLTELHEGGDDALVAWRGVDRYLPSFEEVALAADESEALATREGAVWLITGGLGGLGYLVAEELARKAAVKLVLVSRRAERTPAVEALEAAGTEVLVVQADVTDEAAMRAAVQQAHDRFGPINGVVHAAGIVEDALVMMKEGQSAERVLAPKVQGTRVLEAVTRGEPLERVVYFSSRGAFAGVAGQVDYTSASAFLDAHALRRSQIDGVPVVSLNWSAWQGVGIAAGGASAGRAVTHPLLDRCTEESDDGAVYQSALSPADHWLLDGHRLRTGESLIPGTGYLEIIGAAAEERGRRSTLEIQDVFFFSPFVVRDDETRDLRVRVQNEGADLEVVVEGRPAGGDTWEEHSRGTVASVDRALPDMDINAVRARCSDRQVQFEAEQQRNANLSLGHRWSNLVRIDFGATEALAELRLPDDVLPEVADFRLHPALLDVACACAQELVPEFDTNTQFFIPVSYGRVTVFDDLPGQCLSHIRLQPGAGPDADSAVYDITITTPDGRVVVDVADFTMMRVHEGSGVGQGSSGGDARGATLLQFEGAITPDEGVDVFRRVLSSRLLGQLVVSPQHLETYLQALLEPPEPATGAVERQPAPVLDLVDASEVEAVLLEHDTVEEVVVLAHKTSDGEIKASAFVVWELGEQATIAELRRFLKGEVPEELLPEQLIELEEFPRNSAGEVDRAALPDPFAPKDDFAAPQTESEKLIAGIWIDLLGVSRVSQHDNFLDVGGHSLLAMRAISKIAKATGVRLNPSVMTLNTLSQIAAECDASVGAAT